MQYLNKSTHTNAPPDPHLQSVAEFYNQMPINHSKVVPDSWARFHNLHLARRAGIKPGDYILDAGCGVGIPAIHFAQEFPGTRIEGMTLSEVEAQEAWRRVEAAGLSDRIIIRVGDFHHLPFPDGVFDVAFYNDSIKYSNNLPLAFTEVYRVLRPQSKLYMTDLVCRETLNEQQQQELAKFNRDLSCHICPLSQLAKIAQQVGFQNIELGDMTGQLPTQDLRQRAMDSVAPNGSMYYGEIKATKPVSVSYVSPSHSLEVPVQSRTSRLVYALGTLGYDFGSEARRDSFKQLMPGIAIDNTVVPANPYDARQMVDYLVDNPTDAKSLIWTLNLDLTPIYAIEPVEAFASDVYETLQLLLAGQIEPEDSENYIERASIPARLTDRTVKLFSGQIIPVIEPENIRGMYGWKVNRLVSAALETLQSQIGTVEEQRVQRTLSSFLNRIYYDLRNWGQTDRDRALNFTATNVFQAASTFGEAVAAGMELDSIEVYKSVYCRYDSNCWDVKLKFFDPENNRRARKVFRFTIDVRDIMPVTLGEVRSWTVPS
jgi:cyanobactin maturation PatA/PatG family protease